jgi:Flp pilus assembly protein TadD
LDIDPNSGLAAYALAVAEARAGTAYEAVHRAWQSALSPETSTPARALIAKLHTQAGRYANAVDALESAGPWNTDPLCRNRLAFAYLQLGERQAASRLARQNLDVDPLDTFARAILWMADAETSGQTLKQLLTSDPHALVDLLATCSDLAGEDGQSIQRLLESFYRADASNANPLAAYWAGQYQEISNQDRNRSTDNEPVFPHRREMVPLLEDAVQREPTNGRALLYLGHVLFHLGRHAEAREKWQQAAELGTEPVIAYRALGMAAKTLDSDLKTAREWLDKANREDPSDPIVARDLARVLFSLADAAGSDAAKRELITQARTVCRPPSKPARADLTLWRSLDAAGTNWANLRRPPGYSTGSGSLCGREPGKFMIYSRKRTLPSEITTSVPGAQLKHCLNSIVHSSTRRIWRQAGSKMRVRPTFSGAAERRSTRSGANRKRWPHGNLERPNRNQKMPPLRKAVVKPFSRSKTPRGSSQSLLSTGV